MSIMSKTPSKNQYPLEDPDRARAIALTTRATTRILSNDEVSELRDFLWRTDVSDMERGVALAVLQKTESGRVLTNPEAAAIAIGLGFPVGGFLHVDANESECVCDCQKCPECSTCPYSEKKKTAKPEPEKAKGCGCK